MEQPTRTFWKKNNDSRYISGEDLQNGTDMGKGLNKEMAVMIVSFADSETFDQSTQEKILKTGLTLATLDGKKLYKPLILNNTNAAFCLKEFDSTILEDWLNKPMVLYAKPDKRHGHVARLKKYYAPRVAVTPEEIAADVKKLEACKSLEELKTVFTGLPNRLNKQVEDKKNELKTSYTK